MPFVARLRALFDAVARRERLACCVCALTGFLAPLTFLAASADLEPPPYYHDEYCYLLAGETYALGRASNPTPPAPRHFESPHLLVEPVYMAKYPPAQGLMLALGILLADWPLLGVLLSAGLMAAALWWMLRAYLPGRWALLGVAIWVLCCGTSSYWIRTYWGGMLAAAGGALVFGGARRLRDAPAALPAALTALGLALLANTRPLEGLMAGLLASLLVWPRVAGWSARGWLVVVLGALPLLGATGAGMLAYNQAVTGKATKMPYQLQHRQYFSQTPLLVFETPRPPLRRPHARLARFFGQFHPQNLDWKWLLLEPPRVISRHYSFYLGGFAWLLLGLLAIRGGASQRSGARYALLVLAGFHVLQLMARYRDEPHYSAPFAALSMLLLVEGFRRLRLLRRPGGRRLGAAALLAAMLISQGILYGRDALDHIFRWRRGWVVNTESWERVQYRGDLLRSLRARGGKHLVLVSYTPDQNMNDEWVYNRADMDAAAVIWAHDLDDNQALLEAFPDHSAWRVLVGPTGIKTVEPLEDQPDPPQGSDE